MRWRLVNMDSNDVKKMAICLQEAVVYKKGTSDPAIIARNKMSKRKIFFFKEEKKKESIRRMEGEY